MHTDTKRKLWVLMASLLCGVGGILYGYDIGVISGALLFIKQSIQLSTAQVGAVVGAVFLGGLLGSLIAGPIADYFGRRLAIIFSCLLFILGITLIILAHGFYALWWARLLLGVAIGVVAVAVPLYVAELVPAEQRGRYVTFFQLFLTFGIVLAYFVDYLFAGGGHWRWMFAVVFFPAMVLFVAMLGLPESPRWLSTKGKYQAALKVLHYTHSKQQAQLQLHSLRQQKSSAKPAVLSSLSYKALFIAVSVAVLTQATGINVVLQYAPVLLQKAGMVANSLTMLSAVTIGAFQFVATFIAIMLVDKVGRKPLLILGTIGIVVANLLLVAVGLLQFLATYKEILSLLGLLLFVVFYAIGPGVAVWLVISELFPNELRGRGMAVCLFFNSLAGSALTSFFPLFQQWAGVAMVYVFCAVCSALYAAIAIFLLPETKSCTLEQVQEILH